MGSWESFMQHHTKLPLQGPAFCNFLLTWSSPIGSGHRSRKQPRGAWLPGWLPGWCHHLSWAGGGGLLQSPGPRAFPTACTPLLPATSAGPGLPVSPHYPRRNSRTSRSWLRTSFQHNFVPPQSPSGFLWARLSPLTETCTVSCWALVLNVLPTKAVPPGWHDQTPTCHVLIPSSSDFLPCKAFPYCPRWDGSCLLWVPWHQLWTSIFHLSPPASVRWFNSPKGPGFSKSDSYIFPPEQTVWFPGMVECLVNTYWISGRLHSHCTW